jgi:hypothetical protein
MATTPWDSPMPADHDKSSSGWTVAFEILFSLLEAIF